MQGKVERTKITQSEWPRENVLANGKKIPAREMLTKKFVQLKNFPRPLNGLSLIAH